MLARRVSAEGRTRAYVGGRAAAAGDLREIGGGAALVLRPARAPPAHARVVAARDPRRLLRARAGGAPRGVRGGPRARARRCRASSRPCASGRARATASSTCSSGSCEEIDGAGAERGRGGRAGRRARAAAPPRRAAARGARRARGARAGGRRRRGGWRVAGAARALEATRGVDPALDVLAERADALAVEAEDLAGELRRYGEAVDAPPGRLDEVEERLAPVRAAQAQARRHDRRRARPRRGVPRRGATSWPAPRRRSPGARRRR